MTNPSQFMPAEPQSPDCFGDIFLTKEYFTFEVEMFILTKPTTHIQILFKSKIFIEILLNIIASLQIQLQIKLD